MIADDAALTLYTFEDDRDDVDGDGAGDSDCNDACADTWPPLFATATAVGDGQFTIITRDDGTSRQWAFRGLPLYLFSGDSATGDVNGEGFGGRWFVARPESWKIADVNAQAQGQVFAGAVSILETDGNGGQATTRRDRDGFTLYTFENDRNDADGDGAGDSDCNGACAETWPPLFADNGETPLGDFTIVDRDDGTRQWAFKGLPLYFFVQDAQAGETEGEGFGGVWFVVRPTPVGLADSVLGGIFAGETSVLDVDGNGDQSANRRDRAGFSLYVFDNDVNDADGDGPGDSDCNGACAVTWPPLYADAAATADGDFSLIQRDDGTQQWAYRGEPLYFFAGDAAAQDVNGDQVGDIWHLARSAPVQVFDSATFGAIFSARGIIDDVDPNGNRAGTSSDRTGFTLYRFDDDDNDTDGDGVGDSDCNAGCAVTWPPLYANPGDLEGGDFTIITRDDGSLQWAYKGSPLYFFAGDGAPEQTNGVYGTWHEVTP